MGQFRPFVQNDGRSASLVSLFLYFILLHFPCCNAWTSHRLLWRTTALGRCSEATTTSNLVVQDVANSKTAFEEESPSASTLQMLQNTTAMSSPYPEASCENHSTSSALLYKLQGKLLKQVRSLARQYDMLQDGDHIMVCVSGGKDSAVLLYLLLLLQKSLPIHFNITAVHVDQRQPGYDGTALEAWLRDDLQVRYKIIQEDTYSVVVDRTPQHKSYCTLCSRLRSGILTSAALELHCNKLALGHHGDDAMETLFLNMMHNGVIKGMPVRYTSQRGRVAIVRPLLQCLEEDIEKYAQCKEFPILPCNLCSNQSDLQRPQVKLLLKMLQDTMTPNLKSNLLTAMKNVRPSHLMDIDLRRVCGLDPITGEALLGDKESTALHGQDINDSVTTRPTK